MSSAWKIAPNLRRIKQSQPKQWDIALVSHSLRSQCGIKGRCSFIGDKAGRIETFSLDRLFEFLRFPSVGTDPQYHGSCRDAARWLEGTLAAMGFETSIRETTGQPVVIRVDAYPDRTFDGAISEIAPTFDHATRTVQVTVKATGDGAADLRPGMFATVQLTEQ